MKCQVAVSVHAATDAGRDPAGMPGKLGCKAGEGFHDDYATS